MTDTSSPTLEERYAFRDRIVDALTTDLMGPSAFDEVLDEAPLNRYVTGILWPPAEPSAAASDTENSPAGLDDPTSADASDPEPDLGVADSRRTTPSSMGITFTVDPQRAKSIELQATAARYLPTGSASADRSTSNVSWTREEPDIQPVIINLDTRERQRQTSPLVANGLDLFLLVRDPDTSGYVTITAVLRNTTRKSGASGRKDEHSWFQVGLEATTSTPAIVDRTKSRHHLSDDPDLTSSALLYRDQRSFAIGHGCSADWNSTHDTFAASVRSTFVPRSRVARAQPGDAGADLSLHTMSSGKRTEVLAQLNSLSDEYEAWINQKKKDVSDADSPSWVPEDLRAVAASHLDDATVALRRMRNGIRLLEEDDVAFDAFTMANKAMHMQRARQDWIRRGAQGEFTLSTQSWRPFQLAFILINLPSTTDRQSDERDIADLLWFPAGGGKTEAYLGLIAYLIFLRRIRDPRVEGTAVLMRYTLRLLTIQQFERAAMLICSLESVRRERPDILGDRTFGIGLWVGSGSTPNTVDAARVALRKLRNGDTVEQGNPMQLQACPWCGARLDVSAYSVTKGPDSVTIHCPNVECDYHAGSGIPAHVVDEDVYRVRPELVIGTVDKFARMAWDGSISALFGHTEATDIGPDLIIQDELHLISGPLGSTVGLFESAVDISAGRTNESGQLARPKLVASTATIRRADAQIKAVFNRTSRLFPPPGINPDESFFARPAESSELGDREYIGVMAPGTSHATLLVRTYASLLHTVAAANVVSDEIKDPYWTLIGYFNSLRVLGSAYLQVHDDVSSRLDLLASRDDLPEPRRVRAEELTSRRPGSEIPVTLKQLEAGLGSEEDPLDVVLATNMISVGLDVDRLGLMAVAGQPPSSSEYIQATSRVGRKYPGLVVNIFNSMKSRDRSHYESFRDFHGSLYRAVEATSATPFAARSRDRALHAALVASLRMVSEEFRGEAGAAAFHSTHRAVELVRDQILARVHAVATDDSHDYAATQKDLGNLIATWERAVSEKVVEVYHDRKDPHRALLIDATMALTTDDIDIDSRSRTPWPTPQSMRDVDAETRLAPLRRQKVRTDTESEG